MSARILATDLDRTLLPNGTATPEPGALARFREWAAAGGQTELVYVTGRHRSLAQDAVAEFELPGPDWWICNVGTEIYSRDSSEPFPPWVDMLSDAFQPERIREWAQACLDGARLQEREKQSPLKVSFYVDPSRATPAAQARLQEALDHEGLEARVIASQDETEGIGLVDFLAPGADKARALAFLREHCGVPAERTIFAGDSGNDADALLSGVCGILVGNATPDVRQELRRALADHPEARIYFASRPYTAGILEGLVHYGWLSEDR